MKTTSMRFSHTRLVGFLLCLICAAFLVNAQVITANLSGTVTDSSGSRIAAATVTATNMDNGLTRQVTTGSDGTYVLPFLPVGPYSLKVEASGFKMFMQEPIELSVNQVATVEAQLSVGQVSDTVTVSADANLLTTDTAQIGGVVDTKRITELPLNGRNVLQFVQLMPGAATVNAPQAFATARFGPRLVLNGSRPNENGTSLDGSLYTHMSP